MRRRLLAVATATLMAVSVAACSTDDKKPEAESKAPTSEQSTEQSTDKVLNVYSSRHYDVDKKLYDMFTQETGIKVNVVDGKSPELIERLIREKNDPAADIFLTVGAESIWQLNQEQILGKYESATVTNSIPEEYRGEGWMGIVSRARVIAYDKDKVDPKTIKTYEDITKPEWKGQVLVRSSKNSYNQALLASFVSLDGKEKAKQWAQGVVNNFARQPKGNDRDQAKAVAAGEGKLAIMNSYYWALMDRSSDPEVKKVAEKIGLIFPENTHVNLSYAGIVKGAKNQENAVKMMEFLASEKVQELIAQENGEFPLNPKAKMPEPQKSWGEFTKQKLNFAEFGKDKPEAVLIFDEVGWK